MRILHISDLHFGIENAEAIAVVARFVAEAAPDVIVASGDLSTIGIASELEAACAWLASLGPPVIATPGNHDVPYHEILPRFWHPFARYRRASAGRLRDGWNGDGLFVHTINTARGWQLRANWALGAVSSRQLRAACAALAAAPPDALKVIVTHHPLLFPPDSPIGGQTHGGAHAARSLIAAGADLFLAGHLHVLQEPRVRGPRSTAVALTAGTLSQRLRGEPPAFLLVDYRDTHVIEVSRYAIADGAALKRSKDVMDLETMSA